MTGSLGVDGNSFLSIGWSANNTGYDWDAQRHLQITGLAADGSEDHRLYIMPLAATKNSRSPEEDLTIQFLILHQDKNYAPQLRRIGLLLIWPKQMMLEDNDLLLKALNNGIAYGESIIDEDGRYRKDEEARSICFFDLSASRRDRYREDVAHFQFIKLKLETQLDMEFEGFTD